MVERGVGFHPLMSSAFHGALFTNRIFGGMKQFKIQIFKHKMTYYEALNDMCHG